VAIGLVVVMVGLPARGKSWMARHLARYIAWTGTPTRVFNVGDYRRAAAGAKVPASFFAPDNADGVRARREAADRALTDLVVWLAEEGGVAIYDATNSTRSRRDEVRRRCAEAGADAVFVEMVCTDPDILDRNIRETKLLSPDYAGEDPEAAVADFRARIANYERAAEPLGPDERPSIRLFDGGRRAELDDVHDTVPRRVVDFLVNTRMANRTIYLSRHGQSAFNVVGRIGGDAPLSEAGVHYARRLADHVAGFEERPRVWTSTLRRARQTGGIVGGSHAERRALDEIDAGICDGLTYPEIKERHPELYAARKADKLHTRYPGGESYVDVVERLIPLVLDLERTAGPVLIISHQAVLRALLACFLAVPRAHLPRLEVPLHTVIAVRRQGYGYVAAPTPLGPDVDKAASS
jgi:broad specificity phosphatase PhoE/predicted kinase